MMEYKWAGKKVFLRVGLLVVHLVASKGLLLVGRMDFSTVEPLVVWWVARSELLLVGH